MFETKQKTIELKQTCNTCGKPNGKGTIADWITGSSEFQSLYDRWGCSCDSQGSTAASSDDDLSQQSFGKWKLKSKIGNGYLGSVYLAENSDNQKQAAIRVFNPILSQNRRIAKRFLQEAEKAATLTHRNIAMVYEHGTLPDGNVYVVSEYVEGVSLQEKLRAEGFFDVPEALNIIVEICDALEEAHKQGILHRSVKPSTIIIQPSGSIKLIDFGIEKAIPTNGKDTQCLSQVSAELGNPRYMSPEQCLGETLDERSDLYSTGCVMYEMLTGKIIFEEHKGFLVALAQLRATPKPFSEVMYNSDIPADVESVVLRILEKSREERYSSVKQLRDDIEAIISGNKPPMASKPIVRSTEENTYPVTTYPVRSRKHIIVAATLILGVLFAASFVFAAVSYFFIRSSDITPLPMPAESIQQFRSKTTSNTSARHRRAYSTYSSYYGNENKPPEKSETAPSVKSETAPEGKSEADPATKTSRLKSGAEIRLRHKSTYVWAEFRQKYKD